jgi:teichoic acid transport system permease protein
MSAPGRAATITILCHVCEPTVSSSISTVPPDLQPLGATPPMRSYLRAVWGRRQFAWASATGELRSQHMDTALGNVWHLLNPILLISVYYLVFGVVLQGTVDRGVGDAFIVFLAIGVLSYQWGQRSITAAARSITGNEGLIRSLQFPRALLPLSVILKETLAYVPGIALMMLVALAYGEGVTANWLLMLPIFVLQVTFNLGAGLLLARTADRFRDTVNVLPFVFRLGFYGSGVIFLVDQRFWSFFENYPWTTYVFVANPFYAQLSLWREALMTSLEIQQVPMLWISASAWALGSLVIGLVVFRAGEKEYGRG